MGGLIWYRLCEDVHPTIIEKAASALLLLVSDKDIFSNTGPITKRCTFPCRSLGFRLATWHLGGQGHARIPAKWLGRGCWFLQDRMKAACRGQTPLIIGCVRKLMTTISEGSPNSPMGLRISASTPYYGFYRGYSQHWRYPLMDCRRRWTHRSGVTIRPPPCSGVLQAYQSNDPQCGSNSFDACHTHPLSL